MASNGTGKVPLVDEAEGSETTIEIKIKTLDSQTYTMRVDKQMPVPALKEQIASVTGVLSEQQRLICRGKVLKDDQLLSAYHVEDGHTLHLVVRQPVLQSSEGMAHNPATGPASSTNRSHGGQVGPSVVIETFSVPDHGDGVPPEISRIVSAVLSSFAFANMTSGSGGIEERGVQRTSGASATSSGSQQQSDQSGSRIQSDRSQSAFGLSTAVPLGSLHPPVIPDSLTTLSQYLSLIRREVDVIGRSRENNAQGDETNGTELRETDPASQSGPERERLPTPASLAEVLLSSRQLLIEQIAECLSQLARQLQNQANVTDPAARLSTQSTAWRTGVQLHSLGAFLLELGRTTMTLRLGQGPSEAVVNAGPAVFINPSGPNPLMVQPLPFQSGTSVGSVPVGSVQPGSSMGNGIGTGFLPRRIDIQIRRGSSTATPNGNREERSDTQQSTGQRNSTLSSGGENISNQPTARVDSSSFAGESGVRVVPIRTMMAAVPSSFSRLSSDSSGIGLYYPVVGRLHPVTPGIGTGGQGSQASGDQHPSSVQNEEHSTPQAAVQGQNVEHRIRDGSLPTPSSRQQGNSTARSININVVSASGPQNNQETERRMPHNILQFLRNLFPGGEIHVEDARFQGTDTHSTPENAGASNDPMQVEPAVTDEAIFLSSMLREFMPLITQHQGAEPNDTAQDSSAQAESSHVGTSRRHSDSEPSPPNSKRQKSE